MDNAEAIRKYRAAKDRQYHQRDDVKERRRQRESSPEAKEHIRSYNREYLKQWRAKQRERKKQGCLAE